MSLVGTWPPTAYDEEVAVHLYDLWDGHAGTREVGIHKLKVHVAVNKTHFDMAISRLHHLLHDRCRLGRISAPVLGDDQPPDGFVQLPQDFYCNGGEGICFLNALHPLPVDGNVLVVAFGWIGCGFRFDISDILLVGDGLVPVVGVVGGSECDHSTNIRFGTRRISTCEEVKNFIFGGLEFGVNLIVP
jgi:hypothetical protein